MGAAQATSSPAGATRGGTLTIGVDQEPPTMDPEASPSAITFYITSSVGETLLYVDQNRKIQPWLAESYEVMVDRHVSGHGHYARRAWPRYTVSMSRGNC